MSTIAPNTVETVIFEIKKKGGLSPIEQETVNKAIANELDTPGARKAVTDHLSNLTKSLKTVKSDFTAISTVLAAIDAKEAVKDVHGKPYLFSARWRKLFEDYIKILVKSQSSANGVKSSISTLLLVVVQTAEDPSLSLPEKQEVIADFKEGLTAYVDEESKIVEALHLLSADIETFRDDLVGRLKDQSVTTSETIKGLETRIEQLRQDLIKEDSKEFIHRSFDALQLTCRDLCTSGTTPVACVGFASLLAFIPPVALCVAIAGLASLGAVCNFASRASIRRQELNTQLQQLQEQLHNEHANLGNINIALEKVCTIEENFTSLLTQIKILSQINQMLLMDAGSLQQALSRMGDARGQAMFKALIHLLRPAYKTFDESLTAYILAV